MRKIDVEIGKRLRKLREQLGWSQAVLAKKIGFSSKAISHWEKGERDIPTKALIELKKLGVNIDWLLTGEGEPLKTNPETQELVNMLLQLEKEDPDKFQEIKKIFKSIVSLTLSPTRNYSNTSKPSTSTNSSKSPEKIFTT